MKTMTRSAVVALGTALVACGGSSSSTDGGTTTDAGSTLQPTLSSIQENIFQPQSCAISACHGSTSTRAGGLDLTLANAYTSLLGSNGQGAPIPDSTDPGEIQATNDGYLLVSPGHPEKSFLYLKVQPNLNTAKYGAQMPNTGLLLTTEQVTAIHDWIEAGAQNN